jgi:hypothetical protein
MNSAKNLHFDLFGVKKRIKDIESINKTLDKQLNLCPIKCTSSASCYLILYEWGHIVYNTFPEQKILNIDILSSLSESQNNSLKKAFLEIFSQNQYLYSEQWRITGHDS